ncbi:hypothetical protein B005_4240 [Nocardiopsis alba ATCC BAA-2165]|uniref:Uncharacterized protein n=1 Tax=Nocardiopsis alba (strain ATCC BAA-2165 / BE74) TaxID=1205910 RepID=J7LJT0_NOCAA|nr:hypothetical protein B005_4240 [Nocardiopsis alba ATCC BAA-2165]
MQDAVDSAGRDGTQRSLPLLAGTPRPRGVEHAHPAVTALH